MEKITQRFVHFETGENFKSQLLAGNISEESIVFIKDISKIWTHGQYYPDFELATEEDIDALFE